jgi:hypothetical protein
MVTVVEHCGYILNYSIVHLQIIKMINIMYILPQKNQKNFKETSQGIYRQNRVPIC